MAQNRIEITSSSARLIIDPQRSTFDLLPLNGAGPALQHTRWSLDCAAPSGRRLQVSLAGRAAEVEQQAVQDAHGQGRQIQLSGIDTATGLRLSLAVRQYPDCPFFLLRMRVENLTSTTFSLSALNVFEAAPREGAQVYPGSDRPLDFFKVGWHDWVHTGLRHGDERDVDALFALKMFTRQMLFNPAKPVGKRKGDFWSDNWGILTDGNSALLAGLVSMADQFGLVHAGCRPGSASLTLSCMADGVPLEPGEVFESELGYLEWMALPVEDPMAEYVAAVARQMKPRRASAPPPVMWTHWYYYFEHVTQEQFLENLEAADRLRRQIPYEIFQLDGGYYKHWGDWLDWNERFPIGPQKLSDTITERGFTPGIWLAPFVVDPASTVARQHPEWLVRDRRGKPISSGFFYSFSGNALDLTQPAVLDHIRGVLNKLVHELGFHFIKTDFVYAGALPGVRRDPKQTRAQAFRKGMQAVREGIGEETYLLGCGCPMGPAVGIVDAMRIGPDTCPNWDPFLWSTRWAAPLIKQDRSVASLRNNIRHTINLGALHRRWWWNDPDCLMVRGDNTTLNREEVRSNVSLIGTNGNLIIHSDNLNKLTSEQLNLVAKTTPLLEQEVFVPDLLEREMAETVAARQDRAAGRWINVALFNWSDRPAAKTLDLTGLGFDPGTRLHAFDFWEESVFAVEAATLEFTQIPTHGCKLLRFCPADDAPCLVGDTLHTGQGAEIAEWQDTGEGFSLTTMEMKRHVSGRLFFWLPRPAKEVRLNGEAIPYTPVGENVIAVPVEFFGRAKVEVDY
jgi:alpha-galactosidase